MSRYFGSAGPAGFFSLGQTGFWNNIAEPRAAYYNGKTYFAWIDDAGNAKVASFTHSTGVISTPFTLATGLVSPSGDIHNSVALCVRSSDHKIVAAFLNEGAAHVQVRISTNAEDATAWGTAFNASATTSGVYVSLYQLGSGNIYLFTRNQTSSVYRLAVSSSVDGGATWDASVTSLFSPAASSGDVLYWRIGTDGTKIHIFATDSDRSSAHPSSLYHVYLADPGGGLVAYKSDGTSLGSTWPITITSGTLVQNSFLGSCWADGWGISGGNPACLITVNDGNGGTNTLKRQAHWNGSAWVVNAVVSTGGVIDSNVFIGSGAMVKNDPTTLYIPVMVGSNMQLEKFTSSDGGVTWSAGTVLTSGASDNAMPDTPLNAASGLSVLWGRGTYTSDSSFSFTVFAFG